MHPFAVTTLALTGLLLGATLAPDAARAQFPQAKINYIDTSEAPKIRIFATLLMPGLKPPGDKAVTGVTLFRKPEGTSPVELFGFVEGEVAWPKSMSEEDIKAKEKEKKVPEMALASELDKGAAIVVVAPGHQDPEYKNGTLGERARAGTGLFFKKLGKANKMNLVWYNDDVWTYVYTEGRTAQLSKLEAEMAKCQKWERDQLPKWGLSAEELAALEGENPPSGPKKDEARCGLTSDYGGFGDLLKGAKTPYDGFWPHLFDLPQKICMKPEQDRKTTSFTREGETADLGVNAFEAALQMLVKDSEAGLPKIMILTGDGRDGYIKASEDCKARYQQDCLDKPEIKALKGKAQKEAIKACVDPMLQADINLEQAAFAKKLPTWLAMAKGAGVRIYSIAHPNAQKYQRDRLEVLAWRTGGTFRYSEDANEMLDLYDHLMGELNNQVVITFTDDEAVPGAKPTYIVEMRTKNGKYTSEPFLAPEVAPKIEVSFFNGIKKFGEKKLGKVGFIAALAGIGLIVLVLFLKIGKKIFGAGKAAAGKAGKAAAGKGKAAKDKMKLIEKAKKAKEAQKKAMEKAKKKAGG